MDFSPHLWHPEPKIKTKIGDLRSKTKSEEKRPTKIFSIEIQHDSYTVEVSALPPSLIETKLAHSKN
jgi:hypothetical protein